LRMDVGERSQCFDEPSMSVRRKVTSGTNPVSAYPVGAVAERELGPPTDRHLGVATLRVAPEPPSLRAEHRGAGALADLKGFIDAGTGVAAVVVMVRGLSQPPEPGRVDEVGNQYLDSTRGFRGLHRLRGQVYRVLEPGALAGVGNLQGVELDFARAAVHQPPGRPVAVGVHQYLQQLVARHHGPG